MTKDITNGLFQPESAIDLLKARAVTCLRDL